ncbi:TPA: hypothetical protein DDW69_03600 [candidate division CPR2 bacterium]|uniref:TVP38/TMEM64 family membrane protein n=1 Tax=candidate division CPR2 bacterium GW2011_GWC1_41_48 TaxID=1618344 RepID=A0A0G0YHI4_UNCC2|nr:MAG: hypothetical protein UT47_C0003G0087 [candidate division CPR2 bacterium GW2011_GWC2_39_35]KKR29313.1 MAG: hypothetical protein UT59_C0009G0003 [candidate division CPR2 bacterium GW2011_GWD1_39_7]KKR29371.1 MAG: hypothetical protein UT60_C0003G0048 [candidate division CPR2 bacterium GW2011_GWD2_39_7]KKS09026.1 MAG: hypothetical protein UU65_C0003G0081 [candidate division CPR2 bacterium GW2011_GWC1_41_48]OGB62248.1 MAG: hypothetical protein A2Y27_03350 [candidate division CPR2 bacterium G
MKIKSFGKLNKKVILEITITVVGYFLALFLFLRFWNAEAAADFVSSFGIFSHLIFIFLATLKFIFPVVPGQLFSMTGVLLFGSLQSFIYMMIAIVIGTYFAVRLSQIYGQPFAEKAMGKKKFRRVHKLSGDKTIFTFFVVNMLPGFPKELLPHVAGLTEIPTIKLMIIFIFGRIPFYYMYSQVGSSFLALDFKMMAFWFGALFVFTGILFLIKKFLRQGIRVNK